ncbi:MAG: hypothetical protein HZA61_07630 [Candidatus Eisenbacteria bacterium]|uniref:RnfC Barrel sandwich hybrid domain-containing protein n=1 Tax=Eiseniibacteriota bacterium TaxID=2212470 RepID=A0A933SDL3_UNCEI|nr:hypothetical protein [Candidatus Eisenbacteria bacterium]
MGHSYTPGLRVTESARLERERRLPLRGDVLVAAGDTVAPGTVVARTELPGNVQVVNLAAKLSLEPAKVVAALLKPVGSAVEKDEPIAFTKGLFGFGRTEVTAPCAGVLESLSPVTGQLLLREPPIPVEVRAYVSGRVARVLEGEGVVVETHGAFLQGIFGVGGEAFGPLAVPVSNPDAELRPGDLGREHRGCVVVGGAYVSHDTLMRARDIGVAAVLVGGFDDGDLRKLLGRDLGVAITGAESLGFTLVLTEGFGRIPMAQRTWKLLRRLEGREASVSGATQIRAGVLRPEVIVPLDGDAAERPDEAGGGLEVGALVRVIREPWFGRIGRVVALPAALMVLETEALVRVLEVEFADERERRIVPRANVERIAP